MAAAATMPPVPEEISEKHIISRGSREWLAGPGELPGPARRLLSWAGLSELTAPYEIVRRAPGFGHVLGCIEGEGEVWLGGEWRTVRAGIVFVNPPGSAESLRTRSGRPWKICWVHAEPAFFAAKGAGAALVTRPFLAERDARSLWHALEGLRLSLQADEKDELAETWAELVLAHARRLVTRAGGERRLARLWEEVAKAPAESWEIEKLGALAGMSREQLRRVALREIGRTPMEQVTWLRMRRAADLLRITNETLEVIAEAVGYGNAFVFSNAFTRVMGVRPGAYRAAAARAD